MGGTGAEKGSKKVILASHNNGKLSELGAALAPLGWELMGMPEFDLPAPEETGTTFEANALLKAEAAALGSGLWALADDSGLEVDALDGAPGVLTAGYGGWERILTELRGVPAGKRGAQFICVLALVRAEKVPVYFKGVCRGEIALEGRGEGGFGYDPIFIPDGETRTFAQMSKAEKSVISHRGIAVAQLLAWVRGHMADHD